MPQGCAALESKHLGPACCHSRLELHKSRHLSGAAEVEKDGIVPEVTARATIKVAMWGSGL